MPKDVIYAGYCDCSHSSADHTQGRCSANVEVMHDGQLFIRRCGCTEYHQNRENTLRMITPEELLRMPVNNPHIQ